MDLSLTQDQRVILDALDAMLRPWESAPIHDAPLFASDHALDRALADAGFLEVANDPELGTVTAALVIERLARLPYATEAAASALVGPVLGEETAGPMCLVDARQWRRPLRYLREGARVVLLEDRGVSGFTASATQFRAEPEALFAYPVATLHGLPEVREPLTIDPMQLRARWQVGLASECAGLLAGALASVVYRTASSSVGHSRPFRRCATVLPRRRCGSMAPTGWRSGLRRTAIRAMRHWPRSMPPKPRASAPMISISSSGLWA